MGKCEHRDEDEVESHEAVRTRWRDGDECVEAALLSLPPSFENPRVHASVRGQRGAANMMLVLCNSDVPISLACSIWISNSPDHGIIGTASLGTSKACG